MDPELLQHSPVEWIVDEVAARSWRGGHDVGCGVAVWGLVGGRRLG